MPQSKYVQGKADSKSRSSGANVSGTGATLPAIPAVGQKKSIADTQPLQLAAQDDVTVTAFKPLQQTQAGLQVRPAQRMAFAPPAVSKDGGDKVVQRVLARGGGWGAMRWTGGDAGRILWGQLVTLYNTTLPAKRDELNALAALYPERSEEIAAEVAGIVGILASAVTIPYADGAGKKEAWDELVTSADEVCGRIPDEVAEERKKEQKKLAKKQKKIAADELLIQSEQDKLDAASGIYREVMLVKDIYRGKLFSSIAADKAKIIACEAKLGEFTAGELVAGALNKVASEASTVKAIFDKHKKRLNLVPMAISDKGPDAHPENAEKQQKNLTEVIGKATDEQLGFLLTLYDTNTLKAVLAYADATKLVSYIKTERKSPKHLTAWYLAIGEKGQDNKLKTLWEAIGHGEEDDLTLLLKKTNGDADNKLTVLLGMADVAMLKKMIGVNEGTILDAEALLVTQALDVPRVKALLAANTANYTVPCLKIQPDVDFLEKYDAIGQNRTIMLAQLQMLAQTAPKLVAFVTDVKARTINSVLTLNNHLQVQNAAATVWPVKAIDSFDEPLLSVIKEAVVGIDGGAKPKFKDHPSSGVKWGATWHNNDGDLPGVAGAGGYKEYYVQKPHGAEEHGRRRILSKNAGGNLYYSNDHYATYYRIR